MSRLFFSGGTMYADVPTEVPGDSTLYSWRLADVSVVKREHWPTWTGISWHLLGTFTLEE